MEKTDLGYDVIGDPVPDSTGHYDLAGTYNGKPYYDIGGGGFSIWWQIITTSWNISFAPGVIGGPAHRRIDPLIAGDYLPITGGTGTATVVVTE